MCTWHQDTLGRSSMIDFIVVSSDLRPHVLDNRAKRGAELSTDHHLVVSWLRWWGRMPIRPGRHKRIVKVCWERLAESPVRESFNSHLRESFDHVPGEAGNNTSKTSLIPPTRLPVRKQGLGTGMGSPISGTEVAEVVRKLLGGRAPGVDEVRPEFLKALDVVGHG